MSVGYFCTIVEGKSPNEAFKCAVNQAKHKFGNTGRTGTIAEKTIYTMATYETLLEKDAQELVEELRSTIYSNEHGPAGCVRVLEKPKTYMFFGYSPS